MNPASANPRLPALGIALIVAASLMLSLLFFSPHLWVMRTDSPGSFEWSRGLAYLRQCADPFRPPDEPALHWRRLPPLVAHSLGWRDQKAFLLPWLGVVALLAYTAVLHARRLADPRFVFGGTLLVATTSAVIVPTGWLGINDAWCWLGLLVVAFGRSPWSAATALLLCPWIDERFLIGLPLAWTVRSLETTPGILPGIARSCLWLLPYAAIRLFGGGNPLSDRTAHSFLASSWQTLPTLAVMAPLGWWMGLRAGWIAAAWGLWTAPGRQRLLLAGLLPATLGVMLLLASDLSRTVAMTLPLLLAGGFALAKSNPGRAPKYLLILSCANLFIPAAHIVLTKIAPIQPLPVELWRLYRVP